MLVVLTQTIQYTG